MGRDTGVIAIEVIAMETGADTEARGDLPKIQYKFEL